VRQGFTTVVLYHPARPLRCLLGVLARLNNVTKLYHKVELFIQGAGPAIHIPPSSQFTFDLQVIRKKENTGVAVPLAESISRLDTTYWGKIDDDIFLPPSAWDLLLECIRLSEKEFNTKAAFISPGKMSPILFRLDRNILKMQDGSLKECVHAGKTWHICDYTGLGATIVLKEVFDSGITVDRNYFVAGENLDFCWQMKRNNFRFVHMTKPMCEHRQKGCQSAAYNAIRWDRKVIEKSALYFQKKWGLKNPQLWKACNLGL